MELRLQKALSEYGIMSRRAAEKLISEGKIKVNGDIAYTGQKIDPDMDIVEIDGKKVSLKKQEIIYVMLNKPRGYVTTVSDEKGRKTVMELLRDIPQRIYPIGRLDYDSEGLLLFTNDGEFANKLMHPSEEKDKIYLVNARGTTEHPAEMLSRPMEIDGYKIRPAKVSLIERAGDRMTLKITIHEGRNRQIRKMCDKVGLKVTKLKRVSVGRVELGDLKEGKWRYLTKDEVSSLINAR